MSGHGGASETGITREQAEALCLSAIDSMDLIGMGETPQDVTASDDPVAIVQGLVLYAQILEATILVTRGSDISEIRAAARSTATAWRKLVEQ